MKGRNVSSRVALVLTLTAAASCGDDSSGPSDGEAWQTSWSAFIDAYNECTRTPSCSYEQFANQVVTWSGTFREKGTSDGLDYVSVGVPPKSLVDANGNVLTNTAPPQPLDELTLYCDVGELSQWQNVSVGAAVRFRGRTREGSPIAYSKGGSTTFVVYYLNGCAKL